MGHLGKLTSVKDLPSDKILADFIKQAMKFNEEGVKVVKAKPVEKKDVTIPDYFAVALKKDKAAKTGFDNFSPSQQREYIDWLVEAKTEATREKRMETALEWIAEGKIRNWKYLKK